MKKIIDTEALSRFLTKLNSKILTTKEQILANTNTKNIAGATATKDMFNEINSNLVNNVAGAHNVELHLSGGDNVLSDQLYANWPQIPTGYGCIYVGNGSTVRSGTYIKHSDAFGSITLNRADSGTTTIWSIANGTVKSMPTETYGIIPDAGVNVGFTLRLSAGMACVAIDVVVPQMAAWSSFRLGYVPNWEYGVKVLGTAHSIQGTQSSSVRIDISEAGVVTVNTQAAIAGNQWFYGRNAVCL